MTGRSDRFERLRDNWGNLPPQRCALFARETLRYSEEVIEQAITKVMHDCQYAPVLRDVILACQAVERRTALQRPSRGFRPGDDGPDHRPTFTPEAARAELRRLRVVRPDWFGGEIPVRLQHAATKQERKAHLQLVVSRIYVKGLRRCANLDGRAIIEAEQPHLF